MGVLGGESRDVAAAAAFAGTRTRLEKAHDHGGVLENGVRKERNGGGNYTRVMRMRALISRIAKRKPRNNGPFPIRKAPRPGRGEGREPSDASR